MHKNVFCINVFILAASSVKFPCRDENNKPVDWFYIYKLPKIVGNKNKLVKQGAAYAFITSKDQNGWKLSEKAITDEKSMPGLTLAPIYQMNLRDQLLYILYSDQPPAKTSPPSTENPLPDPFSKGAHAKGAVVGDKTGGFWLVHSVPRYAAIPENNDQHRYPSNAHIYGQSFLCITLKSKDLESAGGELWYNGIHVYATSVPEELKRKYKKLAKVASGENVDSPKEGGSLTSMVRKLKCNKNESEGKKHCGTITSASGTKFTVFAKSEKYKKELYSDWIAPELKVNLLAQTWPYGKSHQQSTCETGRRSVENILNIRVADVDFTTKNDHSKWAISKYKSEDPWVCVGDINKDNSQMNRGGGTVCVKNKSVWEAYFNSVIGIEKCQ